MAFHQPAVQISQKRTTSTSEGLYIQLAEPQQHQQPQPRRRQQLSDSQEWVLFDPTPAGTVDTGPQTSTVRTITVGCSQVSDVRSLESDPWSYDVDESLEDENENEREDEELDSLDSHLLEFRAEPSTSYGPEQVDTVLPTHDGLGSFRLGRTIMGDDIQQFIYKFEKFNPRQVKRQRECMELDTTERETDQVQDAEWLKRIEVWRLEQSRVLDEIHRESRQKKEGIKDEQKSTEEEEAQETMATLSDPEAEANVNEPESFLNRITRKVIQDLIGIDDNLLSIIFGESLASELDKPSTRDFSQADLSKRHDQVPWEYKILKHIVRELENLASKISEHPLGLNTYLQPPNISISYAGLPIIPEIRDYQKPSSNSTKLESSFVSMSLHSEFYPTIKNQAHSTAIINTSAASQITEDMERKPRAREGVRRELTRDEWERDLDLKLMFRYIFDRVATKFSSSSPSNSSSTDNTKQGAKIGTVDTATRAACVRQHHPLIAGKATKKKNLRPFNRTWGVSVPASSVAGGTPSPRTLGVNFSPQRNISHGSGSCVGKREKIISGSSRNFWDWADSVGSSKTTPGTGTMGSWGEV